MEHNRRCWTLGAVLLVVIMGSSALTRGAWAQSHYENLHTFKVGANGYFPESALVMDQAGNLYGTTADGGGSLNCGNQGCGTVFELTPGANGKWTEELLHSFNSNDGEWPQASLIFDQAGNLYGTTYAGGAHGAGTVFQLTPKSDGTWTESVLYAFCSSIIRAQCADGSSPLDSVTFDQAGNLYGTTAAGGSNSCSGLGCGMVFKLTPNSDGGWHETILHVFQDHPGAKPEGGVIFDALGNLYGTTIGDGQTTFGSVFEITP